LAGHFNLASHVPRGVECEAYAASNVIMPIVSCLALLINAPISMRGGLDWAFDGG